MAIRSRRTRPDLIVPDTTFKAPRSPGAKHISNHRSVLFADVNIIANGTNNFFDSRNDSFELLRQGINHILYNSNVVYILFTL